MAFRRRKRIGDRTYLYEVETYRAADGIVHQRFLRYLGPEIPIYGAGRSRKPRKT